MEKLVVARGKVIAGNKGNKEYTYSDEHWVMYIIVESVYFMPETNIELIVIQ